MKLQLTSRSSINSTFILRALLIGEYPCSRVCGDSRADGWSSRRNSDLKPSNLLFVPGDKAVLHLQICDFGVSCRALGAMADQLSDSIRFVLGAVVQAMAN